MEKSPLLISPSPCPLPRGERADDSVGLCIVASENKVKGFPFNKGGFHFSLLAIYILPAVRQALATAQFINISLGLFK